MSLLGKNPEFFRLKEIRIIGLAFSFQLRSRFSLEVIYEYPAYYEVVFAYLQYVMIDPLSWWRRWSQLCGDWFAASHSLFCGRFLANVISFPFAPEEPIHLYKSFLYKQSSKQGLVNAVLYRP